MRAGGGGGRPLAPDREGPAAGPLHDDRVPVVDQDPRGLAVGRRDLRPLGALGGGQGEALRGGLGHGAALPRGREVDGGLVPALDRQVVLRGQRRPRRRPVGLPIPPVRAAALVVEVRERERA